MFILISRTNAASLQAIKRLYRECSKRYFPEYANAPLPGFKIKYHPKRAGWWNPNDRTLYINPDVATDPEMLREVVFHEAIHVYDDIMNGVKSDRMHKLTNGGHGQFFLQHMKRINQGEGQELVKVETHQSLIKKAHKPFYVYYTYNEKGNRIHVFWANKGPDAAPVYLSALSTIKKYNRCDKMFVVQTDNGALKQGAALTPSAARKRISFWTIEHNEKEYKFLREHKKAKEL